MDKAKELIKTCLYIGSGQLAIQNLELTELPLIPYSVKDLWCWGNNLEKLHNLPPTLELLSCSFNPLIQLPSILPSTLEYLICHSCKLTFLPGNLPNLQVLLCYNNQLTKIPIYPSLTILNCEGNKLVSLCELPDTLHTLYCKDNPYLYISEDIAKRFDRIETPNYSQIFQFFKQIHSSQKRKNKLLFCEDLQSQIDEFRYRPTGAGCIEIKQRNKGKWIDT
jgi:hypothetical protein